MPNASSAAMSCNPPSHIVLATDFSARCDRAQDRAVQLAIEWNASLTAVHAMDDLGLVVEPLAREAYLKRVRRNADRLRDEFASVEGLRSTVVVEEGSPDAVVRGVASNERAELIVTGIARAHPMSMVSVGSTVTALAQSSSVPLLVVKKKVLDTNARTLLATDLTASSRSALLVTLNWFSHRYHGLFHAYDPPYRMWAEDKAAYQRDFEQSAIAECRKFVADVGGDQALEKFDIIVRRGDVIDALSTVVDDADIDLVIAGTHGRTGILQVLVGSVASRILSEVEGDVLIVPQQSP